MRKPRRMVMGALALLAMSGSAHAVTVRAGFTATVLAPGVNVPTAAAFAPDGRLIILEKAGAVRLWTAAGALRADPLLTIPVCTDAEMGLLGLAFDPDFVANHYLYLYHTQPPGGQPARCGEGTNAGRVNRVIRVTLDDEGIDPSSLTVLLTGMRTDGGNHDGGCLRFGPDGLLYVAVGDTGIGDGGPPGSSTNPYAHDLQHLEGKILRITRDGSPAPGNPFVGGNAAYVFAYGLRNPFRFAFDPITPGPQLLWAGDVGQSAFEEIDVIRAGDDLGWPSCEANQPASCPGSSVAPIYAYRHPGNPDESVSVTGGVHYDGTQFEAAYRGDYFFGDYGLNEVYRADVNATRDGFTGDVETFSHDGGGPVDFFVGPDGALYWVAIGAGVVRVTQDGQPGAAIGGCERAGTRATVRLLPRVGKRVSACLAKGRAACVSPAPPTVRGRVRRSIGAACDAAGRTRLCARLGCTPCRSTRDLVACVAAAAAQTAGTLATSLASTGPSRCRTAAVRSLGRAGGDRMAASVACVQSGVTTCVPPPDVPVPSVDGLARSCGSPPADVCAAVGCGPCTSAPELATCLAAHVGPGVDSLSAVLLGVVQ